MAAPSNHLTASFADLVLNPSYAWKRTPKPEDFSASTADILNMLSSRATTKGVVIFRGILHGLEALTKEQYENFALLAAPEAPPEDDLKQLRFVVDVLDSPNQPPHMVPSLRELFDEFGTAGMCLHYCRLHFDENKLEQVAILATFVLMAHQSMKQRYVKTLSVKHARDMGLAPTFFLSLEAMSRQVRGPTDRLTDCELVALAYGAYLQEFTNKKRSRQQQQKLPRAATEITKFKNKKQQWEDQRPRSPEPTLRRSQGHPLRTQSDSGEHHQASTRQRSRRREAAGREFANQRRRSRSSRRPHQRFSAGRSDRRRSHSARERRRHRHRNSGSKDFRARGDGASSARPCASPRRSSVAEGGSARAAQKDALNSMKQLEDQIRKLSADHDDLVAVKGVAKRLVTELSDKVADFGGNRALECIAPLRSALTEVSAQLDFLVLPRDYGDVAAPGKAWKGLVECVPRSYRPSEPFPDQGGVITVIKYILKHAPSVLKRASDGAEASLFKDGGVAESIEAMRAATEARVDMLGPFPRSTEDWGELEEKWADGRGDISDIYAMLLCAASKALSSVPPARAEQNEVVEVFKDLIERVKTLTSLVSRKGGCEPQPLDPAQPLAALTDPKEEAEEEEEEEEAENQEGSHYSYSYYSDAEASGDE
jgi:hypothetical protein